jgi:hypothetical protein
MRNKLTQLARGVALLTLVAGLAVPGIGFAADKNDHDDDKDHKGQKEDASEQYRSQRDDRQTTGQVLEINTLKDPPEMWIANADGVVHVRMLTTDLIAKNAVRLGDHVTIIGEKISEVEFDCQEMSVDGHLGDDEEDDDDDDDDDN